MRSNFVIIDGKITFNSAYLKDTLMYQDTEGNLQKKKVILHLFADIGSDSRYYQLSDEYEVIRVGEDIGVENFSYEGEVHGIIANPVCTEFSTASYAKDRDLDAGMFLVNHALRIIDECKPKWYVIENPATGLLRNFLGKPDATYQPYQYGSPWTKRCALWGNFNMPAPTVTDRSKVELREGLYIRPRDTLPSLALLHKSAIQYMPEYAWAKDRIKCDSDIRSLCSDGFAYEFFKANQ